MINNIAKINPKMMKWVRIRAGYVGEYENRLPKEFKANYKLWESGKRNSAGDTVFIYITPFLNQLN